MAMTMAINNDNVSTTMANNDNDNDKQCPQLTRNDDDNNDTRTTMTIANSDTRVI